jgi:hypothetical protein
MIARFNLDHPRVAIDLTVTNTERVEAGLRDLSFTLGVVELPFDETALQRAANRCG